MEILLILGNAILNGVFCYVFGKQNQWIGVVIFIVVTLKDSGADNSYFMALGLIGSLIGLMLSGNDKEGKNEKSSSDQH